MSGRDLTGPLPWACSQCSLDGAFYMSGSAVAVVLSGAAQGPRTDGVCGPHADFYHVARWRRQGPAR